MNGHDEKNGEMARILVVLLCLLILGGGGGLALVLIKMKKPPLTSPPKTEGTLVEVMQVSAVTRSATVEAMGTVIAARELDLKAEVGGRVVAQSGQLVPGSVFGKGGELVCQIDPRDYAAALEAKRAQLAQARTALKIEEGRVVIAKSEWEMLKKEVGGNQAQEELALRKPQLAQAKAAVKAAESARDKAQLDFDRTSISVPFPSVVREEFLEIGQLVSPQTLIARLAGSEKFWVRCSVPSDRLAYISLPGPDGRGGAAAKVLQRRPGKNPAVRRGRVIRMLPELDPAGRMARVLVEVNDPLNVMSAKVAANGGKELPPPLLLGSFVKVQIDGPMLAGVVPLPRKALREGRRVWVMGADDKLEIREAKIAWSTRDELLLSGGVQAGEAVVITGINGAHPGMKLRVPAKKKTKPGQGDEGPVETGSRKETRK